MVIVDTALAKREQVGNPIRVALVGAGVTGQLIALQLLTPITGMRLVAIANRTLAKAAMAYENAGVDDAQAVISIGALEDRMAEGLSSIVGKLFSRRYSFTIPGSLKARTR